MTPEEIEQTCAELDNLLLASDKARTKAHGTLKNAALLICRRKRESRTQYVWPAPTSARGAKSVASNTRLRRIRVGGVTPSWARRSKPSPATCEPIRRTSRPHWHVEFVGRQTRGCVAAGRRPGQHGSRPYRRRSNFGGSPRPRYVAVAPAWGEIIATKSRPHKHVNRKPLLRRLLPYFGRAMLPTSAETDCRRMSRSTRRMRDCPTLDLSG